MSMVLAGYNFDLSKDNEILKLNSPKSHLNGPYRVIYKNLTERWVLVALEWDSKPRLGIRWFHDKAGNPLSRGYATWFVIPPSLTRIMLEGIAIDHRLIYAIDDFLAGKISGQTLQEIEI